MDGTLLKLIELLERTAPEVWAAAVRQARVAAFNDLLVLVFCAVFSIWAVRHFRALGKKYRGIDDKKDWMDLDDSWSLIDIISVTLISLGLIISFVVFITEVPNMLTAIFNPEYFAIRMLLDLVR